MPMRLSSRLRLRSAHSTCVDADENLSTSWSSSFGGVGPSNVRRYRGDVWSCFQRQRFNPEHAIYPSITKKLVVPADEQREIESRKGICIKRREINPNSHITLHKNITTGKYAVYYFGTEKSSNEPKIVKIYRPTIFHACSRRAGLEKQILKLEGKPAALPSVHFAFSYQIYKCLVLEPMYNQSLGEKLRYARRLMPEVVQSLMVDMVIALSFLHTHRIIHRNLTLDSWWLQANNHLKLTDFSYCIQKRSPARWNSVFKVKATEFTAPELFHRAPYSRQTDIWALGIIFYRMSSGRFPFYGPSAKGLRRSVRKSMQKYDEFFPPYGKYLCTEMLEKEPSYRIGHLIRTDVAFKGHIYFENVDWEAAFRHSKNGPPIRWKFPVLGDACTTERTSDEPLTINFKDVYSYDLSKMRVKPLRMKDIQAGNYWFSPEYLEQRFPRKIQDSDGTNLLKDTRRTSKTRRFSLHFHLLEAFKNLETDLAEGNDEKEAAALQDYYTSIRSKIKTYNQEKQTASVEALAKTEGETKTLPKVSLFADKNGKKAKSFSEDGSIISLETTV